MYCPNYCGYMERRMEKCFVSIKGKGGYVEFEYYFCDECGLKLADVEMARRNQERIIRELNLNLQNSKNMLLFMPEEGR